MKHLITLCCWLYISLAFGQNHQVLDTSDHERRKLLVKAFEKKYEQFNKQLKNDHKGAMRRELMNYYEQAQTNILQIITTKKLLFDARYQNYIDSLYAEMKVKNPVLNSENINLYLSKNTSPNALSVGDGTLIFNIGLFSMLENEYQLQSVIAHEVGHHLLGHTKKNIEEYTKLNVETLSNTSDVSKSLHKDKYNKGERSFNLLKDLLYKQGELKRRQEIEADSLGFVLFRNSNAPLHEFITALEVLKNFDSVPEIVLDAKIYRQMFDIPEQKFNEAWLANEDFESYNYNLYKERISLDSIDSHPEIDVRIATLKTSFPELNTTANSDRTSGKAFNYLQEVARQAYVENLHYLNEYGLSTYLALKRLEEDPNNAYYKKWLGINFEAIYEAKKKYQLNRYVDRLVPNEQSESYQLFLNFIWNLDLKEIKAIASHYNRP